MPRYFPPLPSTVVKYVFLVTCLFATSVDGSSEVLSSGQVAGEGLPDRPQKQPRLNSKNLDSPPWNVSSSEYDINVTTRDDVVNLTTVARQSVTAIFQGKVSSDIPVLDGFPNMFRLQAYSFLVYQVLNWIRLTDRGELRTAKDSRFVFLPLRQELTVNNVVFGLKVDTYVNMSWDHVRFVSLHWDGQGKSEMREDEDRWITEITETPIPSEEIERLKIEKKRAEKARKQREKEQKEKDQFEKEKNF